jgi:hypothetical protein
MFTSEKMVKFLREKYPPGTRIRLVSMEDPLCAGSTRHRGYACVRR